MRIVFFGTGEFAVPILAALTGKTGWRVQLVVSQPAKPAGRNKKLTHSPVSELALKTNLQLITPETLTDKKTISAIFSARPDIIINAAYGRLIPKEIYDSPPLGSINVHPSVLPQLRGASPIQQALLEGLRQTGVTLMIMDEKIDHGPILSQEFITINELDNHYSLEQKLARLGAEMLLRDLEQYRRGELKPTEQNHLRATYTRKITAADGRIEWTMSAEEIFNRARALAKWPGLYTFVKGRRGPRRLKLIEIEKVDHRHPHPAGTLFLDENKNLLVKCGAGAIRILKIQPESRKILTAEEFLNGWRDTVGQVLT